MKTKILKTAGFTSLILFLYFLIFVFMTYPLILRFSSAIPGNGGDQYLMTWFFWEFYHYVFVLHKFPYFTHLVYYPFIFMSELIKLIIAVWNYIGNNIPAIFGTILGGLISKKRCQIYLFLYSRLRLTRPGVFVYGYLK